MFYRYYINFSSDMVQFYGVRWCISWVVTCIISLIDMNMQGSNLSA